MGYSLSRISLLFVLFADTTFHYVQCKEVTASCYLYHYSTSTFIGQVYFSQQISSDEVKIHGCIDGLPVQKHGFHVHKFGDITQNCMSAGGHFNPEGKTHGDITDTERHVGDLGNLDIQKSGNYCFPEISDRMISLLPGKHSIIGRSLAVHRDEDDLGRGNSSDSKTTGHSGPRVACCVIGLTSDSTSRASLRVAHIPFSFVVGLCLLNTMCVLGSSFGRLFI